MQAHTKTIDQLAYELAEAVLETHPKVGGEYMLAKEIMIELGKRPGFCPDPRNRQAS